MGQMCGVHCSCWTMCSCCCKGTAPPRYAKYTADSDVDFDKIVGDLLELDPIQFDRETGMSKIRIWIESIIPIAGLPQSFIAVSQAKCIKYWQAIQSKPAAKLSGSYVRFLFEKRDNGELPRLLIEHKGKSVIVRSPGENSRLKPSSKDPEVHV
ncbi:predicted protein [Nematostella vectensis]|uniref:Uncharacterized protein n=1 Tax=Nematostella vectensis TaxID=45351 RepID=A7S9A7_NEMVE|nr:uncharacterized protein LOC5511397 [Nematostella vectensis]EDO39723.1 predicted protein [Nematostella vectensis]|eukprot:XP_001631786.1 predicted protein [Nematostella vectensis]